MLCALGVCNQCLFLVAPGVPSKQELSLGAFLGSCTPAVQLVGINMLGACRWQESAASNVLRQARRVSVCVIAGKLVLRKTGRQKRGDSRVDLGHNLELPLWRQLIDAIWVVGLEIFVQNGCRQLRRRAREWDIGSVSGLASY